MRGQSCSTRTKGPELGGAERREESLAGRSDSGVVEVSPCSKFWAPQVRNEPDGNEKDGGLQL